MKRVLVATAVLIALITAAVAASQSQPAGRQETERFYVTGFVKSPGSYEHQPAMTVLQGLAMAGGLAERGSDRGIKIIRVVEGQNTELDVSLHDLVLPNDTIRVRQRLQ